MFQENNRIVVRAYLRRIRQTSCILNCTLLCVHIKLKEHVIMKKTESERYNLP